MNTANTIKRGVLNLLRGTSFPVGDLGLLTSGHSTKGIGAFQKRRLRVRRAASRSFRNVSVTLFDTKNNVAGRFSPTTVGTKTIIVSGADTFHVSPRAPLIIPRIGPRSLHGRGKLVTGPGYSAVRVIMTLRPLHRGFNLSHIVISACRTMDNTKLRTLRRLGTRARTILGNRRPITGVLPYNNSGGRFPVTFGTLPRVSIFDRNNCACRR